MIIKKHFYRVGFKYFTRSVGNVYNKERYGKDYYNQSFSPNPDYEMQIETERKIFGEKYIDMMSIIKNAGGNYAHFTPDLHLYSEDGIHLTQAGAKEYAKRLNVKQFFSE